MILYNLRYQLPMLRSFAVLGGFCSIPFTFSTMVLPSKCEGPLHLHDDVEEVFFMLKGQITLMIQDGDSYTETVLRERDLISVPAGIYRGLFNHGEEEALMCVMLGTPKPHIPTYPEDHPLSKVKRS